MPIVFPFGEGRTEEVVFSFLQRRFFPDRQAFREFVSVKGKNHFRSGIEETVQGEIQPNKDIRILVFRDLDAGESSGDVVHAFRDVVWDLLSNWNLRPDIHSHQQHPNVYVCTQSPSATTPGLRLILHLADNSALHLPVGLSNHTADGYVLAAGLTNAVLERFARKPQVNSNAPSLRSLIINSIPQTVQGANIAFGENKDYLAAYLCASRFWVVHRTEDQARLVHIILERGWKDDQATIRQVFATWRASIEETLQ